MSKKLKKRKKTRIKKSNSFTASNLEEAIQLHQAGNISGAESTYRAILSKNNTQPDALNLLANIYQQRGDYSKALKLISRAIKRQPERPDLHSNLGSALRGLQKLPEAISSFKKALTFKPDHFESIFNLANCYLDLHKTDLAVQTFEKAICLKPKFSAALEQLASAYILQGKMDAALACLEKVLSISPEQAHIFIQKGEILQKTGKLTEAIDAYNKAIEHDPDNPRTHNNLGNILGQAGRLHDSISCYQKAIELDPELNQAYVNLSWVYKEHGLLDHDIKCLETYLTKNPHSPRTHSDLLFSMNYHPGYTPKDLYTAANKWWQRHAPPDEEIFTHKALPHDDKKLNIGFLSPDFRQHPVGTFIAPLLASLADKNITINCYAEMSPDQHDSVTQVIRTHTDIWRHTLGLNSREAAQIIHNDQVDVLIDLAGHSSGNRLDIMALKPAPIQISWLGYVNTTGLPVIDYRLTDQIADPEGSDQFYSEKLIRLPDAFFCFSPNDPVPDVSQLPAKSNGYVTFGSLNNIAKITKEVIALWSDILKKCEGSRLIIVGRQFSDLFIKDRYLNLFSQYGVETKRIEICPELPMEEYLKLYNQIDIALDPFPHNGHTITCHTLWMGVPVIALAGERYAARMGASVLHNIGLHDLIAANRDDYKQSAIKLASDLNALIELRQGLRSKVKLSPICNTEQFANDFIEAINYAWRSWCHSSQ